MKTRYFVEVIYQGAIKPENTGVVFWRKIGGKIEFMDDSNKWQSVRLTLKDLSDLKEITVEEFALM